MSIFNFFWIKSFVKQLLTAIFVLLLISFISLKALKFYTGHKVQIKVPNLIGMSLIDAKGDLTNNNLQHVIQDSSDYDPNFPAGSVIKQNPLAGSSVKFKRKVYLILNPSNYKKISIPNVIRKTLRQAKPSLESAGFKIGQIKYIDDLGKDEVIRIRHRGKKISVGDSIRKMSELDLIVGNGNHSYNNE